ncbi:MAG: hypothetical protein LBE34_03830 [Flavobacteriaceae bacterium]|jgi:hypothetical protein|nr:hypothetical protein [Flavobacteriaceae bacterium]
MSNFPENFEAYFASQPERFEKKLNNRARIKNILWFIVLGLASFVLLVSEKHGFIPWAITILLTFSALVFGYLIIWGSKDYMDKQTGGFVVEKSIKKFDSHYVTEIEIYEALQNRDFRAIVDATAKDNQPLQIYVYEDKVGKKFYLLLMKYFSTSEFKGISDVTIVEGADYDRYKKDIYKITL